MNAFPISESGLWHRICGRLAQALLKGARKLRIAVITQGDNVKNSVNRSLRSLSHLLAVLCIGTAATQALAHGDVVPQAVDTKGLKNLGADWQASNPYRKDKTAIRIGDSAFNQNCARCHGLGAISGGIAPDLRYLPLGDEGDEVFMQRIRKGAVRDGRVYMPPFEGTLSQEAMWAIRTWVETVHED